MTIYQKYQNLKPADTLNNGWFKYEDTKWICNTISFVSIENLPARLSVPENNWIKEFDLSKFFNPDLAYYARSDRFIKEENIPFDKSAEFHFDKKLLDLVKKLNPQISKYIIDKYLLYLFDSNDNFQGCVLGIR